LSGDQMQKGSNKEADSTVDKEKHCS